MSGWDDWMSVAENFILPPGFVSGLATWALDVIDVRARWLS